MGGSRPRTVSIEAGCESGIDMQGVFLVGEVVAGDMVAGDVMTSDHAAVNLPYVRNKAMRDGILVESKGLCEIAKEEKL